MAKRKARRKKRTLSQPRAAYLSRPRKRRGRKKRGTSKKVRLSDLWNPTMAANAGRQIVGAAMGGAAWGFTEKMIPMTSPGQKLIYGGVAAFITSALFKMPNIACGMAGAATYSALKDAGFMAEGEQENTYVKNMDKMPLMLMNDQPIDPQMGIGLLSDAMQNPMATAANYYTPQYASPYNQVYSY